jgi:hypothetical protein
MADIGLPKISITFASLGVSAISRGSKGTAVLIIKDDTDTTFTFAEYTSTADLDDTETAKYTADNLQYIYDCLEGSPLTLIVARMDATNGVLNDLLTSIKGKVTQNCWIGIAEGETTDHDTLVDFVTAANTDNDKRYKALVYSATSPDDMHVVNFTNSYITFTDDRGQQTGETAIAYLLGYLSGLSLDVSSIASTLSELDSVTEPDDVESAVNSGEFVLYNDEGDVRVARGVNSLITTDDSTLTDDMKYILIVEVMDLIYSDIYTTWKNSYKGKYKNSLDNQMLLISALNTYFTSLANESLLDPEYDNVASIDTETQREANYDIYGQDEVDTWTDDEVKQHTVGTNVYLTADIKILNAMEDLSFTIYM